MKNIPIKYAIAIAAAIVAFIALIVWKSNGSAPIVSTVSQDQIQSSGQAVTSSAPAPAAPSVQGAPRPVAGKTVSPSLNYKEYITQLSAYQDSCNKGATSQFNSLYGTLGGGSYSSYYNQADGFCYMKVTGTTRPAYATTTTAHIYFRNVNKSSLIAECTDSTGTLADVSWSCVNRISGAPLNKTAFDALVYSYTTSK